METLTAIHSRRSIRKYSPADVSDELVKKLIIAGMYAPSASNKRPWHFVVIRNRSTFSSIIEFHPHARMLEGAPAAILVCGDKQLEHGPGYAVVDCSAAVQNVLLAAHDQGLGACWIGIHPREERKSKIAALISLPDHIEPIALISLGYPAETRNQPDRADLSRLHYEHW